MPRESINTRGGRARLPFGYSESFMLTLDIRAACERSDGSNLAVRRREEGLRLGERRLLRPIRYEDSHVDSKCRMRAWSGLDISESFGSR